MAYYANDITPFSASFLKKKANRIKQILFLGLLRVSSSSPLIACRLLARLVSYES